MASPPPPLQSLLNPNLAPSSHTEALGPALGWAVNLMDPLLILGSPFSVAFCLPGRWMELLNLASVCFIGRRFVEARWLNRKLAAEVDSHI